MVDPSKETAGGLHGNQEDRQLLQALAVFLLSSRAWADTTLNLKKNGTEIMLHGKVTVISFQCHRFPDLVGHNCNPCSVVDTGIAFQYKERIRLQIVGGIYQQA